MSQPTRADFEDFLFKEAALLDEWRLDEWYALFAEGATYHVPSNSGSMDGDSATQLFYVADDYTRLRERIVRLKDNAGHAEFPRSIVLRSVTNVRILSYENTEYVVECVFNTQRARGGRVDSYFGKSRYRLDCGKNPFKILSKRSHLAMDMLYPGKLSILI